MAEVGSVFVSVVPSMRGFSQRVNASVSGMTVDVGLKVNSTAARREIADVGKGAKVDVNVDPDTVGASRKLSAWSKVAGAANAVSVKVDLDRKSLGSSIVGIATLSRAMGTLAVPAAAVAATPYLLSLASSAAQASGALALLPAAGLAAGLAIGTVKTAFKGFGDAIGDDPKKAAEALAKMAPAAQQAAGAVNGLKPAWNGLQLDVQSRMFDGLAGRIAALGANYIPVLRTAMGTLATTMNGSLRAAFDVLNQRGNVDGLATSMSYVNIAFRNAAVAVAPVTQAFLTLIRVGSTFLPQLGAAVGNLGVRFGAFIDNAARTGQLTIWIQNAINTLRQLGALAGNVGSILGSLFGAARSSGESFLGTLVRISGGLAAYLKTPEGAAGLSTFFAGIRTLVAGFIERLIILWPLISALGGAFFALLQAASPLLDVVFRLVVMALTPLVNIIGWMAPVLGPVIAALWLFNAASSAGAIVVGLKTAALWALNGVMVAVRIATMVWTGVQWLLNAALSANPIGLIVLLIAGLVAGVIYAYQNFEWFRVIVQGAWAGIQAAAMFAWNNVIKPVFDFIVFGVRNAGAIWSLIWSGAGLLFSTVWNGIQATAIIIWTAISTFFSAIWNGLLFVFRFVWDSIRAAAVNTWTAVANFLTLAFNAFGAFFRAFWDGLVFVFNAVWAAIRNTATFIWNGIAAFFTAAFNGFGIFFRGFWDGISAVFTFVWTGIRNTATFIWNAIQLFFSQAFAFYSAFFTNTWNFISSIFTNVWNFIRNTAVTIWNSIQAFFTTAFAVYSAFFTAVWNGISAFFTNIWNTLRNTAVTIWNSIAGFFGVAFAAFTNFFANVWNNISNFFADVWRRISDTGVNAWNNLAGFFGRAFAAFTDFFVRTWNNIRDAFGNAFGGIIRIAEDVWNRVKAVFAGGLNDIIRGVNFPIEKINVTFGVSIPTLPALPAFADGGIMEFANGGIRKERHQPMITRSGGPTRIWSEPETGGEAYIPMGRQKRDKAMPVLGTVADRFGYTLAPKGSVALYVNGGIQQFADGGLHRRLAGVAQNLVPGTRVSSSFRPGDRGYHGRGKAVDLVGDKPRINRTLAGRFPNSSELIFTPGINLKNGRPHTYNAATRADHFDHVHWAMENEAMLSGAPGLAAGGDSGGSFFDIGFLLDPIIALGRTFLKGIIPDTPPWLEPLGVSMYDKGTAGAKAKIEELIGSFFGTAGGGAEQWRSTALQALALTGQPASFVERVLQQINIESSGNPRAINLTDINARRGTPSKGLIQTIDPTFQAHRLRNLPNDPFNPLANIVAGIRYTISRYGSLTKWPVRGGYDQGGIATGMGFMAKQTIQPERVLSPRQTLAFERLIPTLEGMRRGGAGIDPRMWDGMGRGGGSGMVINQTLAPGADANEIATQTAFALRRHRMGSQGVHSR